MGNCVRFYNKIPKCLTELTESKFKMRIKTILMQKAYYTVGRYVEDKDAWNIPLPPSSPLAHRKHNKIVKNQMF